jgi:hypothetical protein
MKIADMIYGVGTRVSGGRSLGYLTEAIVELCNSSQ